MRPQQRAPLVTLPPVAVGARERAGAERAGSRAGAALGALIRCYQVLLSPALGPSCRFAPSCSEYMRQALRRYGVARGLALGLRRLFRCHPFHPGGWDPVE